MAELLFYILSAGALIAGVGVVTARMPIFSLLSLLGAFFCLAGIYLLAGFQFLAATQLLVYAGAIMVLFLYVIMLLNLGDTALIKSFNALVLGKKRVAIAAVSAGALALAGVVGAGWGHGFVNDPVLAEQGIDDLEAIATILFSRYMLPFEASSLLLLACMVAVIVLAKRQRGGAAETAELGWPFAPRTAPTEEKLES